MKVLILGGGITGLSAAWFITQKYPHAHVTLLEKEGRLGGWIRSSREGGFFFEKGPRTFVYSRSPHLLALIRSLGLEIFHSPPQKRYLFHKGKLRSLSSFIPGLLPYLVRELFIPPTQVEDESIYDFAARRFSPHIAETFFDPLTLGIYGGDIRKLSLRCCFPSLYQAERQKGSVVRSLLFRKKSKEPQGLFTLQGGMETLIAALQKRLPIEIVLHCPVESIESKQVIAGGKKWEADHIVNALPLPFPAQSLWVVNLAYAGDVLRKKGYGYLVPSQEKQPILGTIFDSSIFPQQNVQGETRLTTMVRPEEKEPLAVALQAARQHLGISAQPLFTAAYLAKEAIPQFPVGCAFTGSVSIEGCLHRAKNALEVAEAPPLKQPLLAED